MLKYFDIAQNILNNFNMFNFLMTSHLKNANTSKAILVETTVLKYVSKFLCNLLSIHFSSMNNTQLAILCAFTLLYIDIFQFPYFEKLILSTAFQIDQLRSQMWHFYKSLVRFWKGSVLNGNHLKIGTHIDQN